MKGALLAGVCGVFLLPVLAIAAGTAVITGAGASGPSVIADIPARYLQLYEAAATRYRLPWELLAAIGKLECDHGRDPDPSCTGQGAVNSAGAGGPMQFLATTWATYRVDADRDGRADRWNPADAIYTAARYLKANGAPTHLKRAIYTYNHSQTYIAQVLALMQQYREAAATTPPVWTGAIDLGDPAALAHAVLHNPRIALRPEAVGDVRAGRIDPRLLAVLLTLSQRFTLAGVGPFITGHSTYVAGTHRVSNHTAGRAADIGTINGQPVRPTNPAAQQLVTTAASLPVSIRPTEIGSPFLPTGCTACFTNADHQDHVHLGFDQ